jgi:hypothetical protein
LTPEQPCKVHGANSTVPRDIRMEKVVDWLVHHTEFSHDASARPVDLCSYCGDFAPSQLIKGIFEQGLNALSCPAFPYTRFGSCQAGRPLPKSISAD